MTMKVSDLAKELEMPSKELVERATAMGIQVKGAGSPLSDIDEKTLRNIILAKRKKEAETRIVRVASHKNEVDHEQESKVKVKVAKVKAQPAEPAKAKATRTVKAATGSKATGTPVRAARTPTARPAAKPAGPKPTIGKPMPKRVPKEELVKEKEAEVKETLQVAEPAVAEKPAEAPKVVTPEPPKPEEKKPEAASPAQPKPEEKKPDEIKPAETKQDEVKIQAEKPAEKPKAEKPAEKLKAEKPAEKPKAEKPQPPKAQPEKAAPAKAAGPKKTDTKQADRGTSSRPQPKRDERKKPDRGGKPEGDRRGSSKKQGDKSKYSKKDSRGPVREPRSLEKKVKKRFVKPKPVIEPEVEAEPLPVGTKVVNVPITIAGFCEQVGVSVPNVILTLLKMGVVANQNQNIDEVTVATLADEMNIQVVIGKVEEEEVEEGLELFEDREKDLEPRSPIITVMGHVDHGKTSLLDAIRKTNVTAGESGGITQHIGASEVEINGEKIVFLDTPGHEAFTAMRARGADITDIAVLVVAADDSVKPQTIESISHAKAAGVPIIVAVNKIDKPAANPDRVKQDLTEHGIVVEDYGGDVICVPVSAKTGEGIVNLLEMILIQAEVLELKANPGRLAMGTVIEARLDKARGPVASLLVTNGTLKVGQSIVAGTSAGRIRLMSNHLGEPIHKAGPATAVEVLGLTEVPAAGDRFNAVGEDRLAKEIAEKRRLKQREEVMARTSGSSLEELFSQIEEGEVKELNLVIKADVRGSIGALIGSLEKLSDEKVKVRIIHSGVGAITESDVTLAGTSGAIVIGFNVRPSAGVMTMAEHEGVEIRTYRVIYDIIDDIESAMKGMLDPEFKEEVLGQVEVRETFKVPGAGIIAGSYVTSGKIRRNAQVRLVRDGVVIHEGTISSLKRFKDDAKEVAQGYECGVGIDNYNDIKVGDVIECFHMVEIERK
ncbi:MAG: translation initiation factor IF-2 [Anaerovoracaceae bacterium]|jgi:translation initiation factor IF-2